MVSRNLFVVVFKKCNQMLTRETGKYFHLRVGGGAFNISCYPGYQRNGSQLLALNLPCCEN